MDDFNNPDIETIVFMASAQVGKTETLLNVIGYYVHLDACPIMLVFPKDDTTEEFSKDRLAPMIEATPELRNQFAKPASRSGDNTLTHKQFVGGYLIIASAESPSDLASKPIRVLLCDEIDRYPLSAGTEGDPVDLATQRTKTFWNKKIFLISTPTVKGVSRIAKAYEQSDRKKLWVPCPHCDFEQVLEWEQVRPVDEADPRSAKFWCLSCATAWSDSERVEAVAEASRRNNWRAEAPLDRVSGYWINELYSPFSTIADVYKRFKDVEHDPLRLQTFINTALGRVYDPVTGETLEAASLTHRVTEYGPELPEGVLYLTAGVDTQKDRLEVVVIGWGPRNEMWVIDRKVIPGDPYQLEGPTEQPSVWEVLDTYLKTPWTHVTGPKMRISVTLVDSGGMHTQQVYAWCKSRRMANKQRGQVFASKGATQFHADLVRMVHLKERGVYLVMVGASKGKQQVYSLLQNEAPGPAYIHFRKDVCDISFFEQLTAEKLVTTLVKGKAAMRWEPRHSGARNEVLDCTVLALAAYELNPPNLDNIRERLAARALELKTGPVAGQTAPLNRSRTVTTLSSLNP